MKRVWWRPRARTLAGALAALVLMLAGGLPAAGQQSESYSYDDLGRLKTVTYASGVTVQYTYDAAGNRTQTVVAGTGNTSTAVPVTVIVVPLNGFTIIPIRDPNCSLVTGCG